MMKKYIVAAVIALAVFVSTMPASAETVFNEASKWVQDIGKECKPCEKAPADAKTASCPKKCTSTDAIGNVTPMYTDNSGKTTLGS